MTTEPTLAKVQLTDGLGPADEAQRLPDAAGLVACALCGEDKGYTLCEGSTYRWWSVNCTACGQVVADCRSNYPAETTPRTTRADDAWNDAGAHAEGLRNEIAQMRADFASYFALADASWRETCEMAAKHGITSIPIGPAHAKAMDKFNDLLALYGPNGPDERGAGTASARSGG